MTWHDEMNAAAVRLAFPDWEQRSDDGARIVVDYNEGGAWSDVTFEDESFYVTVEVWRSGHEATRDDESNHRTRYYEGSESMQFWRDLIGASDG